MHVAHQKPNNPVKKIYTKLLKEVNISFLSDILAAFCQVDRSESEQGGGNHN